MKDIIPSLEELMASLEKMGMHKQASELRDIASNLGMGFNLEPLKAAQRPMHSRGVPAGKDYTFNPSEKMLQEGERYTELDPETGSETTKRYKFQQPLPVTKLQPYFQKGMFDTDFAEKNMNKETDPNRKAMWRRLLEIAEQNERQMRMRAASEVMSKCASALRGKGYEALAERLEARTAAYAPGKGVRVRSLKEYIEESKAKPGTEVNLYVEMFDHYMNALQGAESILRAARTKVHNVKNLEEALKLIMVTDKLFMDTMLRIGEITELTKGEGI